MSLGVEVVEKPIADLSGGEKTRVALAKMILTGANFLILDEPTNHLDLPAREAIESALKIFDGTILIVTHDRYLLDNVTTRVIEMKNSEPEKILPQEKKSSQKKISEPRKNNFNTPKKSDIQTEKVEAQIAMAEAELKMLEVEINNAIEPEKLRELADSRERKIFEIDELYLLWEEVTKC